MTSDIEPDGLVSADEALARLMAGNARFVRGEPMISHPPREVLANLAKGQRPFATILGCSDSRVPPELLFDAAFGELFIIRVAGNLMSPSVAGSLQYAGTHLGTQLFMVLGHEGCGAVQAALAAKFEGLRERSRIQTLLEDILPGLEGIDPQLAPPLMMRCGVEANVRWTMRQLVESPEWRARQSEDRFQVVGAVCDITTGQVRLLPALAG
ncbi:MAG: carbonic anhydrase [Chromatiaceae bacterium]|jgi:carbonic anhydrase|uniref:carbonic anhydrase n=1 Tax=Candidatus Skiveiella danica TaxID=3386177 RepID=UPI001B5A6AE8|nr:carbonic anhydrase [Comamonadaceae bacterium]MBK9200450.1 carbonic anhydrase [Betaproteobacteria bacterium]MBP6582690.1 carbonic anhydrase [Chromatiaceae bacterium]MBK6556774.1 carbonic anhydrase [Comamonadaceae bacterium]MBK6926302.1 carbonic anhydrase [Comamonadaceae bacterium]